jgi:hypothetical protein
MLNWLRNWRMRRERKNWHLACPGRMGPMAAHVCERWASKENVAKSLMMPENGFLVCEDCGQAHSLLHWRDVGQAEWLRLEQQRAANPPIKLRR